MRFINVAAISLNQTPLDWHHNKDNILAAIKKARSLNITLLCFPELCITGYGCDDMFLSIATCQMALKILREIANETEGLIVAVGLPILYRDGLYNTVCLLVDGDIVGFTAKQNLAGNGIHYEPRWFKPWPPGNSGEISFDDRTYPLGDIIFEVGDIRIGFEICEDAWAAVRTGVSLAQRGVDLILNPSASHFAFGKSLIRKRFVKEAVRAFKVGYIYANLLGNEAGRVIYDGDTLIGVQEDVLVEGPRFSFEDRIITNATIDIHELRMKRAITSSSPKTEDRITNIIKIPFHYPTSVKNPIPRSTTNIGDKSQRAEGLKNKEEEFARAVTLGLFDYMRKSQSCGFVINLSGGSDSAACACLVYFMVHFALQELGIEGFQKKLAYIRLTEKVSDKNIEDTARDYIKTLLFSLYQQTENSSATTKLAASTIAEALGFPLAQLNVDNIVQEYKTIIEPFLERPLNWQENDITLQNIQPRVRSPSAWLIANVRKAILLCTSNRSEASIGYTTMDGDTAGGLAPLAGIDKAFILQWLHWLQNEKLSNLGPFPFLKSITAQSPTAELRPQSHQQTDEQDIMPYDLLDQIERLFIRDKRAPLEILEILHAHENHKKQSKKELATYIERFFILWCRNQWKRERIAPSFHLDEENVDPKTGCRFPILSGGFKKELEIMWASL